jgi:hypothetical protein
MIIISLVLYNIRHMAQTAAKRKRDQGARDRARLGDVEFKRIEAEKLRAYRASKRSPSQKKSTIINNQPVQQKPVEQPQANKPSTKTNKD